MEVRKTLPKITLNVDINKTLSPKTYQQHESERPLTVVEASGSKRGNKFDLPLFCNTGAGLDICSLQTTKLMGLKVHYDPQSPQNIYDVSGKNIPMVGYTIIYIHHGDFVRPMKVNIARNLGRDGEIIVSYKTLKAMGMIPDQWPAINTDKFAQWDIEDFDDLEEDEG